MAAIPHQHDDKPDDEILKRIQFVEGGQSESDVKPSAFSNYGWIYIRKIINNTNSSVHFYNPYNNDKSGDINAGDTDLKDCKGYLPLWSYDKRYEITYYNETFQKRMKIKIKDLDGDWLASFETETVGEDIREFTPPSTECYSEVSLTIQTDGYGIYAVTAKCNKGGTKELFG